MAVSRHRERKYFPDPATAEKFAARLRGQFSKNRAGTVADPDFLRIATIATDILKPFGVDLVEAAKFYARTMESKTDKRPFRDVAADYIARNETGWSDRYAKDVAAMLKWLPEDFLKLPVCEIEADTIRRTVEALTTSKAVAKRRTVQINSILAGKGKEKKAEQAPLLTIRQIRQMFLATISPDERRMLAVLLFAGIRPDADDGEITRLDWSDFKAGEIIISREVSKTDSVRHIVITPRLARMIKGHPAEGTLVPNNWRRRWKEIRRAAGLCWKDETRHCFASHALVQFGEGWTIGAMGHTKSMTTWRHYARAISPQFAKAFFGFKDKAQDKPKSKPKRKSK